MQRKDVGLAENALTAQAGWAWVTEMAEKVWNIPPAGNTLACEEEGTACQSGRWTSHRLWASEDLP